MARVLVDWSKVEGLGVRPDAEIAAELGVTKVCVMRNRVKHTDVRLPGGPQGDRIDWRGEGIGKIPDSDIARKLGVTPQTVAQARNRHGLLPPVLRRAIVDLSPATFNAIKRLHPKLPPHRAIAKALDELVAELERKASARRRARAAVSEVS